MYGLLIRINGRVMGVFPECVLNASQDTLILDYGENQERCNYMKENKEKSKKEQHYIRSSFYADDSTLNLLSEFCKEWGFSRSALIRIAISKYVMDNINDKDMKKHAVIAYKLELKKRFDRQIKFHASASYFNKNSVVFLSNAIMDAGSKEDVLNLIMSYKEIALNVYNNQKMYKILTTLEIGIGNSKNFDDIKHTFSEKLRQLDSVINKDNIRLLNRRGKKNE